LSAPLFKKLDDSVIDEEYARLAGHARTSASEFKGSGAGTQVLTPCILETCDGKLAKLLLARRFLLQLDAACQHVLD